jgi:hypothetical protein
MISASVTSGFVRIIRGGEQALGPRVLRAMSERRSSHCGAHEQGGHARESRGVVRAHAEKRTAHQARRRECGRYADHHTDACESETLSNNFGEHVRRRRAERHPNTTGERSLGLCCARNSPQVNFGRTEREHRSDWHRRARPMSDVPRRVASEHAP